MEPTQPGIYHIHVDAVALPDPLREYALNALGFVENNFSGHPEGYRHFEPNTHLTLKISDFEKFRETWAALEKGALQSGLIGYLEGEYIRSDEEILERPYKRTPVPFNITRRRLAGPPHESFREAELHLVMDKDRSSPALIGDLLEAGLYGAHIPKQDHTAVVLSIQGFREDIGAITQTLRSYLQETGGAVRCTLKEEVAIRHRLFNIDASQLPEIAAAITWR